MGSQSEYDVVPNPLVPNVWHVKVGYDLTIVKASILEDGWFELARFGDSHVVHHGVSHTQHLTARNGKVIRYNPTSEPHY